MIEFSIGLSAVVSLAVLGVIWAWATDERNDALWMWPRPHKPSYNKNTRTLALSILTAGCLIIAQALVLGLIIIIISTFRNTA